MVLLVNAELKFYVIDASESTEIGYYKRFTHCITISTRTDVRQLKLARNYPCRIFVRVELQSK